jgi:hypothetical protein
MDYPWSLNRYPLHIPDGYSVEMEISRTPYPSKKMDMEKF